MKEKKKKLKKSKKRKKEKRLVEREREPSDTEEPAEEIVWTPQMYNVVGNVGDEEAQKEAVQQGLPGGGLHPSEQAGAGWELQPSEQHLDVQGQAHPAAGHCPGGQLNGGGHWRAQGGAEREESGGRHPEV